MTVKWSCHFKFVLRCYLFYAVGGRATKSSQISRERIHVPPQYMKIELRCTMNGALILLNFNLVPFGKAERGM